MGGGRHDWGFRAARRHGACRVAPRGLLLHAAHHVVVLDGRVGLSHLCLQLSKAPRQAYRQALRFTIEALAHGVVALDHPVAIDRVMHERVVPRQSCRKLVFEEAFLQRYAIVHVVAVGGVDAVRALSELCAEVYGEVAFLGKRLGEVGVYPSAPSTEGQRQRRVVEASVVATPPRG